MRKWESNRQGWKSLEKCQGDGAMGLRRTSTYKSFMDEKPFSAMAIFSARAAAMVVGILLVDPLSSGINTVVTSHTARSIHKQ